MGGTLGLGREVVGETVSAGRDIVGGTIGLGKNVLGETVDLTKQVVGGTVGLGRDIVGGAVGLGRDIVGGAVGLGREVVGEVAETAGDVAGALNPLNYTRGGGINVQNRYGSYYSPQDGRGGQTSTGQIIPKSAYPRAYGVDPITYYGASSSTQSSYVPITADFSAFGR